MANRSRHSADSIAVGVLAGVTLALVGKPGEGLALAAGCFAGIALTPDLDLGENRYGCAVEAITVVLYVIVWMVVWVVISKT